VGGGSGTTLTALRGIERATRESVTYWIALASVVTCIAGGLLAIATTLFFRQGLWGFAQERWGCSLFPTQRRLLRRSG
jgi:hypothetical protein